MEMKASSRWVIWAAGWQLKFSRFHGAANLRIRCRATVGEVGNAEQSNINWGKAGRKRWLGVRPTVRGVAMNPVDHPHGGGEGKTSGGRHPVSPWGQKEGRTRSPKKASSKYIVRRRKTNKKR